MLLIIIFTVTKKSPAAFARGLQAATIAMILFSLVLGTQYYHFAKPYKIRGGDDYIANEWLDGFSLEEMEGLCRSASADPVIVYIGRYDCADCRKFEDQITPYLEEQSIAMPTYYTNLDRESNEEALDSFLDEYHIESVPFLMYIEKGVVKKTWTDPIQDIAEIQETFSDL